MKRRLFAKISRHEIEDALRVALGVGLPLLALHAIARLDLAVYAAFGGLAMLYGHDEPPKRRMQSQIVAGAGLLIVMAAGVVFSAARLPVPVLGGLLAVTVAGAATVGAAMKWVPRGEMFFVLVLLIIAGIPTDWDGVPVALAVGAAGAAFAVLLAALHCIGAPAGEPNPEAPDRRFAMGYRDLDRRRHLILIGSAVLGVLAAWLMALMLDVGHPFWAPVTVAALMPALASADIWRRTLHLMLGTLGGVGIAAVLFSFNPGHLALIAVIVICQAAAEIAVARNYGIALLFFSPLAIGMSNLSRGLPWPPVLLDRLAEAALGTAVALLAIIWGRRMLKPA